MKLILMMLLGSFMLSAMDDEQPNDKKIYLERCSKQEILDALAKKPRYLKMQIVWLKHEDIDELVDAVLGNESIEELVIDLREGFVLPANSLYFWAAFGPHNALKKLTIYCGVMKETVAQGLPYFTGIEEFTLRNLTIRPKQAVNVAEFITKNPLKKFALEDNTVKDLAGRVLINALHDHANLEEVILKDNIISVPFDRVCDVLLSLKKLRHVSFHQQGLDDEQLGFLAQGIDKKIPFVDIKVCGLRRTDGFSRFMTSIQGCSSLHSFLVHGEFNEKNVDDTKTIQEILQAVNGNKNIKSFTLCQKILTPDQIECVVEFIKTNASIQFLGLQFKGCSSLHSFQVHGEFNKKNVDDTKMMREILQAVNGNKNIKSFTMSQNISTPDHIECVVEFIKTNASIQFLALSLCCINIDDIYEISTALKNNFTLTNLAADYNIRTRQGRYIDELKKLDQRLKNYLQRNSALATILPQPMYEHGKDAQILEIFCCAQNLPTEVIALLYPLVIILNVDKEYAKKEIYDREVW